MTTKTVTVCPHLWDGSQRRRKRDHPILRPHHRRLAIPLQDPESRHDGKGSRVQPYEEGTREDDSEGSGVEGAGEVKIRCQCREATCPNALWIGDGGIGFKHAKLPDGQDAVIHLDPNAIVQLITELKGELLRRVT